MKRINFSRDGFKLHCLGWFSAVHEDKPLIQSLKDKVGENKLFSFDVDRGRDIFGIRMTFFTIKLQINNNF